MLTKKQAATLLELMKGLQAQGPVAWRELLDICEILRKIAGEEKP